MALFSTVPIQDKAALEVGHIIFSWSTLEGLIGEFNSHLLGINPIASEAKILDGNMDIRSKVQTAKGLAYLRHFDQKWLSDTLTLLDHVDNNLRPRRNSIVHAEWFIPNGRRVLRRQRKTKIIRPKSFHLSLETEQLTNVRISDLQRLRRDIQETWSGFLPVFWYMCDGEDLIDPASSPTISWKKYLRLAGLGNPLRNVNTVRKRQQKSSPASI